jgi:hypothetical protein
MDRMTRMTSSWNMVWALDEDGCPPPSIVMWRDTEALKLAQIADKVVLASERTLSANNSCRRMLHALRCQCTFHQSS